MSTSKVPALIDYLVAEFQGAATLGAASPPVAVYDGPVVTAAPAQLVLYVGLQDPDSNDVQAAATFTQQREDMGTVTRGETTTVNCVAEAWSGADTVSAVRTAAFGIVAAVEALVRADNTMGGLGFQAPGVAAGELLQNNTDAGAIARVPFTITVRSFT